MRILNRITGSQDETEDEKVDYWCVRWMPFNSDGGFRSLDDWDEMEDPVDRETFEWNHPDPEPGRYRLFAVRDSKYIRPPEELRWKWIVDDPSESKGQSADQDDVVPRSRLHELEEKLDTIMESSEATRESPELRQARLRAKVMELALNNPHFMRVHGEKVALAAFDALSEQRDNPGFPEYRESPIGAGFYELTRLFLDEPHKLKEIGQNAGAGVDGLLSGLASRPAEQEQAHRESSSESEEASTTEHAGPSAFEYGGPTTLADLEENGESESIDLVEELEEPLVGDAPAKHNGTDKVDQTDGQDGPKSDIEVPSIDDADRDAVGEEPRDASTESSSASPSMDELEQQCQFVYPDGSQCENQAQEGSQFCATEEHSERQTETSSAEPNPSDENRPSPEEIAEML